MELAEGIGDAIKVIISEINGPALLVLDFSNGVSWTAEGPAGPRRSNPVRSLVQGVSPAVVVRRTVRHAITKAIAVTDADRRNIRLPTIP